MNSNVRQLDPPQRPRWLTILAPDRRADHLLAEYLSQRLSAGDRSERAIIRQFLVQVGAAKSGGNPLGIGLKCRREASNPRRCLIYAATQGPQRLEWLPAVSLELTAALTHIVRETGPNRLLHDFSDRKPQRTGDPDSKRRVVLEKIQPELVPGRNT